MQSTRIKQTTVCTRPQIIHLLCFRRQRETARVLEVDMFKQFTNIVLFALSVTTSCIDTPPISDQVEKQNAKIATASSELTDIIKKLPALKTCKAQIIDQPGRLDKSDVFVPTLYVILCPSSTTTMWQERTGKSTFDRQITSLNQTSWTTALNLTDETVKNINFPLAEISIYDRNPANLLLSITSKHVISSQCLIAKDSRVLLAVKDTCAFTVKDEKFNITTSLVDADLEITISQ